MRASRKSIILLAFFFLLLAGFGTATENAVVIGPFASSTVCENTAKAANALAGTSTFAVAVGGSTFSPTFCWSG